MQKKINSLKLNPLHFSYNSYFIFITVLINQEPCIWKLNYILWLVFLFELRKFWFFKSIVDKLWYFFTFYELSISSWSDIEQLSIYFDSLIDDALRGAVKFGIGITHLIRNNLDASQVKLKSILNLLTKLLLFT
jgi:hypothetical protein